MLPGIVFSINCCVNPCSKYSAFEIIYGKRPNFPLSPSYIVDFKDISEGYTFLHSNLVSRLTVIRQQVKANILVTQKKMETIENENIHELKVSVRNYVYLTREPVGQGRKCQHTFDGPFVVNNIPRPHMVILRDPTGKRTYSRPVHVNRLRLTHPQAPWPASYFNKLIDDSSHNDQESKGEPNNTSGRDSEYDDEDLLSKHTLSNSEIYTDSVPEKCTEKSNRPQRQIKNQCVTQMKTTLTRLK